MTVENRSGKRKIESGHHLSTDSVDSIIRYSNVSGKWRRAISLRNGVALCTTRDINRNCSVIRGQLAINSVERRNQSFRRSKRIQIIQSVPIWPIGITRDAKGKNVSEGTCWEEIWDNFISPR